MQKYCRQIQNQSWNCSSRLTYAPTKAEARDAPIPDINDANFLLDFIFEFVTAGRFSSSSLLVTTSGITTTSSLLEFKAVDETSSFAS